MSNRAESCTIAHSSYNSTDAAHEVENLSREITISASFLELIYIKNLTFGGKSDIKSTIQILNSAYTKNLMLFLTQSAAVYGIDALIVDIEVNLQPVKGETDTTPTGVNCRTA